MLAHTRAIVAAAIFALVTGRKVAGVHDHAAGTDLDIAAEARGDRVQAIDGGRDARISGTLPEIYDEAAKAFISLSLDGNTVQGHDRGSATSFEARVDTHFVQLYDHAASEWFTFDMRDADADTYRAGEAAA